MLGTNYKFSITTSEQNGNRIMVSNFHRQAQVRTSKMTFWLSCNEIEIKIYSSLYHIKVVAGEAKI